MLSFTASAFAGVVMLDFDTPATGSELATAPLVTPLGTISARFADIEASPLDPDFTAAGASGNYIDWQGSPPLPELIFDFDVEQISFLYGGNNIDIIVTAYDAANMELAEFRQFDLFDGSPAGPATITATGIRRIDWTTSEMGCACALPTEFLALDNVTIADTAVPEPATAALLLAGSIALGAARAFWRRRTFSSRGEADPRESFRAP